MNNNTSCSDCSKTNIYVDYMIDLMEPMLSEVKQQQLCGTFLCIDCFLKRNRKAYRSYMWHYHPEVFGNH